MASDSLSSSFMISRFCQFAHSRSSVALHADYWCCYASTSTSELQNSRTTRLALQPHRVSPYARKQNIDVLLPGSKGISAQSCKGTATACRGREGDVHKLPSLPIQTPPSFAHGERASACELSGSPILCIGHPRDRSFTPFSDLWWLPRTREPETVGLRSQAAARQVI